MDKSIVSPFLTHGVFRLIFDRTAKFHTCRSEKFLISMQWLPVQTAGVLPRSS